MYIVEDGNTSETIAEDIDPSRMHLMVLLKYNDPSTAQMHDHTRKNVGVHWPKHRLKSYFQ